MLWALYDAPVTEPSQVLVLLALADHVGDDGRGAWPSVATIAAGARCKRRTVQYALRALEQQGLIRKGDQGLTQHHRADRRPVVWDLVLPRGASSARRDLYGVQPTTSRGATQRIYGVQPIAPEPSTYPSRNRPRCDLHGSELSPRGSCSGCAADRLAGEAS